MEVLLSHTHLILRSLAYFEPKKIKKKSLKKIIKEILCNFLVRALQYLKKNIFFANENMKKHFVSRPTFSILPFLSQERLAWSRMYGVSVEELSNWDEKRKTGKSVTLNGVKFRIGR